MIIPVAQRDDADLMKKRAECTSEKSDTDRDTPLLYVHRHAPVN